MNKRRSFRSAAALLLVCCLVVSLCSNVFAAEITDVNDDDVIRYVSLGASQTNGYGMKGYLPDEVLTGQVSKDKGNVYGYRRAPEGAYPDLVRDVLEAQGHTVAIDQLAISSMRAEELRVLLDHDYYGDKYTSWRFVKEDGSGWFNMANPGGLDALREEYQEAIRQADVITVDIGVNNFGVYSINRITSPSFASADFADIFEGEDLVRFEEALAQVTAIIEDLLGEDAVDTAKMVTHVATTLAYALTGYCVNFDAAMEIILDLNPDATVVVVSIQNLMHNLLAEIPGSDEVLPLGDLYAYVINLANTYTATLSPWCERYVYANAAENGRVEYYIDDIMVYDEGDLVVDSNLWDCFHLLDGTLDAHSAIDKLFAQTFAAELSAMGLSAPEFFGYGALGMLQGDAKAFYDEVYIPALYAGYDTLAQIMKVGANIQTVDLAGLLDSETSKAGEKLMESYIYDDVTTAILAALDPTAPAFELDEDKYTADSACAATLAMGVRASIGNSFFAHPNANGHQQIADSILTAVAEDIRGDGIVRENFKELLLHIATEYGEAMLDYLMENHQELLATMSQWLDTYGEQAWSLIDMALDALGYKDAVGSLEEALTGTVYLDEDPYYVAIVDEYNQNNDASYADLLAEQLDFSYDKVSIEDVDAIEQADLITVGFTQNEITTFMVQQVKAYATSSFGGVYTPCDWSLLVGQEGVQFVEQAKAKLESQIAKMQLGSMTGHVMVAVDSYAYAYVTQLMNIIRTVNDVAAINPEALVVLVGQYNPMENAVLTAGEDTIALGEYVQYLVDVVNLESLVYAMMTGKAIYVDAPAVETVKEHKGEVLEMEATQFIMNLLMNPNKLIGDLQPCQDGHDYVKEQIWSALTISEQPEEPEDPVGLLGDADGNGVVNNIDAMLLLQYYAGLNVTVDTTVCDVDGNGAVNNIDAMLILQHYAGLLPVFPAA